MPRRSHKTKSYKNIHKQKYLPFYKHSKLSTILQTRQQMQVHEYMISVQQSQCSALGYAIRSQSVLTTIQLGVSTMFNTAIDNRPVAL